MNAVTSFQSATADTRSIERRKRDRREMERLRRSCEALLLSHRGVLSVGPHDEVEELGAELGLERHDFCAFDTRIGNRRAALVCVPSRLWQKPDAMSIFYELKAASRLHGYDVLLVPQTFIERQPRLHNAFLVSGTSHVNVTPTDRMNMLGHLLEHGSASVYELAGVVKHSDPISSVLHLVTTGALHLDLNARITPHSMIHLSPEA